MQNLYELLKASKGLPVSDMYAALWGKSVAESGIKTITGRLPLYFRTNEATELKLRDWTVYGNNNIGKNLFEITAESQTINGVTFTVDKQAGTIIANGTSSSQASLKQTFIVTSEIAGEYYFSGRFNQTGSSSTFDAYMYDLTARRFITKWDGTTPSPYIKGIESQEALLIEGHNVELTFRIFRRVTVDEVIFKPMLRKADTSSTFEPYQVGVGEKTENGYVVNIGVGFAPIPSNPEGALYSRKTINIGESPLTEGQTLSLSQFGDISILPFNDMYIAAFEGFAGGDQLSYNQPSMMVKFKE